MNHSEQLVHSSGCFIIPVGYWPQYNFSYIQKGKIWHWNERQTAKIQKVPVKQALGFYFYRSHKFHSMSLDWTPIINKAKLLRARDQSLLWLAMHRKIRSERAQLESTEKIFGQGIKELLPPTADIIRSCIHQVNGISSNEFHDYK